MSVKIKFTLSILLLAVIVILASCAPDSDKPKVESSVAEAKIVVARVNGEPIYKSDVLRRMRAAYGGDIEKAKADPNRWQMLMDVATETEIMDELLLQTAVAEGMTVSTEEAQGLLDRTKEMAGAQAFAEMLKERGEEEDAFRNFLVERELIIRYKDKLFSGLAVDEDAQEDYYEGHQETFTDPVQVRLETLTFGVRETAEEIHRRWKGSESFDTITEKYQNEGESVGRRTRWMPMDAVPAELQSKVAEADVGTILEPAQIFDKFYVVRVVEKIGARARGFAEVKDEIGKTILNLRKNKALDEWYKAASQEAKIEYVH